MGARGSFKGSLSPRSVPEVAAGYFWEPAAANGSGTASFLMPEGNGKSTYDMVTPAAGTAAPSTSFINGQPVIFYANGSPDKLCRTSAVAQRGFTGATMIWGWVNMASAAGVPFGHARSVSQFYVQFVAGDVRVGVHDGVSVKESRFPNPTYANGPFYYEAVFDPSQAATNRIQFWLNRAQTTPTVAASPGTSMQDTAEFLTFGGITADSSIFNYSVDFSCGVHGITMGLPSEGNRDRLFQYRRLA